MPNTNIGRVQRPHRNRLRAVFWFPKMRRKGQEVPERKCVAEGCEGETLARGLCNKHYQRFSRTGTLEAKAKYADPDESFSARTAEAWNGCVEWTGNLGANGYGRISVHGKRMKAHRYAWERANGPIPEGMMIDHICWNRACVNVEHLRLATHAQNAENLKAGRAGSKSGLRGVYWSAREGKWYASAVVRGRTHYGGYFSDLDLADEAARDLRARLMTHAQN